VSWQAVLINPLIISAFASFVTLSCCHEILLCVHVCATTARCLFPPRRDALPPAVPAALAAAVPSAAAPAAAAPAAAAPAAAAPAAGSRHGATAPGASRASVGATAERREHLDPVPENLPFSVEGVCRCSYAEYHDKIRWAINSMGAEGI